MNYFSGELTENQAKKVYKEWAVKLHPDKEGGSHSLFVELQNQYEQYLNGFCGFTFKEAKTAVKAMNEFLNANEFIRAFNGVVVELTGTWVWLSGNTQPFKEVIKEKGYKWSRSKKKWYKAPYALKGRRKGTAFAKIKNTYGYESTTIQASDCIA